MKKKFPAKLFEGFKYPIHTLKEGQSAILEFPDLSPHAEVFTSSDITVDPEVMIRYFILMYTPGSPAILQYSNVGKRKTYVMDLLGIEASEDGVYEEYNELLLLRSPAIRSAFVTFLMIQHSIDWAFMMHAIEELQAYMALPPTTDADEGVRRRKLMDACRLQAEEALGRIVAAERSRTASDAVEWFRAQRSLKIRPEERIFEAQPMVLPENARSSRHGKKQAS